MTTVVVPVEEATTGSASLLRTSSVLILSGGLTGVLGLVYWAVAARLLDPTTVGRGTVFVSTLLAVSGIGQLGLSGLLGRYLPTAARPLRLVAGCYAAAVGCSMVLALAVVLGARVLGGDLAYLGTDPTVATALVLGAGVYAVFALQDACLVALGRASWLPAENAVHSVVKLALLVALAGGADAVAWSWLVPTALAVVVVTTLLARQLAHQAPRPLAERPSLLSFAGADFAGSLFGWAVVLVLPVLVAGRLGLVPGAVLGVCLSLTNPLDLVAHNLSTSLTVHVSRLDTTLAEGLAQAARRTRLLLLPAALLLAAAGPLLLRAFGSTYTDGTVLLALMAVAAVPRASTIITTGGYRVTGDRRGLVVLPAATHGTTLVLAGISVALGSLDGVGVACLVGALVGVAVQRRWRQA